MPTIKKTSEWRKTLASTYKDDFWSSLKEEFDKRETITTRNAAERLNSLSHLSDRYRYDVSGACLVTLYREGKLKRRGRAYYIP